MTDKFAEKLIELVKNEVVVENIGRTERCRLRRSNYHSDFDTLAVQMWHQYLTKSTKKIKKIKKKRYRVSKKTLPLQKNKKCDNDNSKDK